MSYATEVNNDWNAPSESFKQSPSFGGIPAVLGPPTSTRMLHLRFIARSVNIDLPARRGAGADSLMAPSGILCYLAENAPAPLGHCYVPRLARFDRRARLVLARCRARRQRSVSHGLA